MLKAGSSGSASLRVTANGKPAGSSDASRTGVGGKAGGGSAAPVKKKMVIKPFKVQPQLPDNFEDATWEKLHAAVCAVQRAEAVTFSKEELYRAVEDLCAHKMAARLYERLSQACDAHIATCARALAAPTPDTHAFLCRVAATWADHCEHMLTIRNIFLCLDRTQGRPSTARHSLWDLGLHQFRQHMKSAPGVETRLIAGLLGLIEREREGEDVSRELLCSLLRMLTALGVYGDIFEGRFLSETEAYYAAEGTRYMGQADVPHFLRHVETRLAQESDRVVHYLDARTRRPLLEAVEAQLLSPHVTPLLERGFAALMDAHRLEDLRRLYSLLRRVKALTVLKTHVSEYVKSRGAAAVMDKTRDADLIQLLLEQRQRLDEVLIGPFMRDDGCTRSAKDAWEHFINLRDSRPAELLAKFFDVKLRGEKGVSDEEVEAVLDRAMVLFRFLAGKDVFEAFYKRDLSKRLLLNKSASAELESSMILKLKTECGGGFTSKMEGMFKDIDLSRALMTSYSEHLAQKRSEPGFFTLARSKEVDVSVHVLTTGYWPAYPPTDVTVPAELSDHMARFEDFYMAKYQGRRVAWQHGLGHCILKTRFASGRKELDVSQLQATVLILCFGTVPQSASEEAPVSLEAIKAATQIEDGELRRTLKSLACGKVRLLKKEPAGREVDDVDVFTFDSSFKHKLFRIRINTIQLKETIEENTKTHEAVFRDRQYQVDAAIVRVMKARKTLSHPLLMSELMSQLKFPAKPLDLKKRIESLIERDYLERDEDNPQMYNYLA